MILVCKCGKRKAKQPWKMASEKPMICEDCRQKLLLEPKYKTVLLGKKTLVLLIKH